MAQLKHEHARLAGRGRGLWKSVHGPISTFVASMWQLGWDVDGFDLTDDTGRRYNMVEDSPAALVDAVKRSVRRWRAARIAFFTCGEDLVRFTTMMSGMQVMQLRANVVPFLKLAAAVSRGQGPAVRALGAEWKHGFGIMFGPAFTGGNARRTDCLRRGRRRTRCAVCV